MHDKDKHDAPKHAAPAKHDEPAHAPKKDDPAHAPKKDDPAKDEHKIIQPSGTFAPTTHEDAVEEGAKAAVSHRATTKDIVEEEHEPVKVAAPHPFVGKMTKLKDKIADVAKKHKEEVLALRDELQKLMFEAPGDMPGHSANSFTAVATQIEEGLNMLDPDCSARAPG